MATPIWLITIEMREAKVCRRRTIVWRQTVLTMSTPDDYIAEHHGERFFVGREDETHVEMVLLFAILVAETPQRLAVIEAGGEVGQTTTTEFWP